MKLWLTTIVALATVAAATAPACAAPVPSAASSKEKMMSEDPKIAAVLRMVEAWDTQNWQLVGDLFTEDAVLHSMMIDPVVGREAISARIKGMGAGVTAIKLHIHNIGRIGDLVFVERTDEFTYKGHQGKVPVVGVIEVEGDKIKLWREYYDRAMLLKGMGLTEDFH